PFLAAERQIPTGACVLSDNPTFTIAANRFLSDRGDCSPLIDPIGTDYALSNGRNGLTGAGRYRAVQDAWLHALTHAQYVWLSCGPPAAPACNQYTNRRIPWTPAILAYFSAHFKRSADSSDVLYVRDAG